MKKSELISKMKGGSIDHKWDVIVAFNRIKCNRLLALQYLTNLAEHKVNRIEDGKVINDSTHYTLSNLVLGQPRLSFENASLEDPLAKMIIPFIAGRIDVEYYSEQEGLSYLKEIVEITEASQYNLTVNIRLKGGAVGNVDEGKVTIDLVENGFDFVTNLSDSSLANKAIGEHLETLFAEGKLPVSTYELGQFIPNPDSPLSPREFRLVTMSSDESGYASDGSQDKDGAVLVLVRAGNSGTGTYPTKGTLPYLIPDDADSDGNPLYDSALIVSSNTLFRDFLQDPLSQLPDATVSVEKKDGFSYIKATTTLTGEGARTTWSHTGLGFHIDYSAYTNTSDDNKTVVTLRDIEYAVSEGKLDVSYSGNTTIPVQVYTIVNGHLNPSEKGTITVEPRMSFQYRLESNPENLTLSLIKDSAPAISFSITEDSLLTDLHADSKQGRDLAGKLKDTISVPLQELAVTVKDFELFPTANLLFPEQNAFRLITADLPGDILALGQLDPQRTAMEITPLTQVVSINSAAKFSVIDSYIKSTAAVTWEVLNIDGESKGLGTIVDGVYSAPDKTGVDQASLQELIVARDGDKIAKAQVTIVANSVSIDPSFYFTSAGENSGTLTLSAITAPATDTIVWEKEQFDAGGTLSGNGNTAVYTPPDTLAEGAYALDLVAAKNTNTGQSTSCAILNFERPNKGSVGMASLLPAGDIFLKPGESVDVQVDPGDEETASSRHHGDNSVTQLRAIWEKITADPGLRKQNKMPATFGAFCRQVITAAGESPFSLLFGGGELVDTSEEDDEGNTVIQAKYTAPENITTPCAAIIYYVSVNIPGFGLFTSYNYKIVRFPPSELADK